MIDSRISPYDNEITPDSSSKTNPIMMLNKRGRLNVRRALAYFDRRKCDLFIGFDKARRRVPSSLSPVIALKTKAMAKKLRRN
jgi:hypothetical protein